MQNICIIGGSNSLLRRGWAAHFKENYSDRFNIRNLSVGAATSLMGIFRFLTEEIPDGSTVIWEYALNESNHFRAGQSLESVLHHLDWFMETARRRQISVLPLFFWTQDEHEAEHKNEYRIALAERISGYGLSAIDAWDHLEHFADKQGVSISDMFSGNMHYSVDTPFLRGIAEMVAGRIEDATIPTAITNFDGVSLTLVAPTGGLKVFKNSIVHTSVCDLHEKIVVEASGKLLASYVIAACSAGAMSVAADDEMIGVYSLQGPADIRPPGRIIKHVVHWESKDDLRDVKRGLAICGCNPSKRPTVQNMFAWRGPLTDESRMDAYICSLFER